MEYKYEQNAIVSVYSYLEKNSLEEYRVNN